MPMSKSEAGKLGALKLKENLVKRYEEQPNTCKHCSSDLPYKKRHNTFCNRSCAASYNNVGVRRNYREDRLDLYKHDVLYKKHEVVCEHCSRTVKTKHLSQRFCSTQCHNEHKKKVRMDEWRSGGRAPSKVELRKYLLEAQQNKCNHCGVPSEWNGKPLVLEIEHIDGNSENDCRDNLEMLCPNCHSQTLTYKNRNNGNGRHYRRVRYQEGKSY